MLKAFLIFRIFTVLMDKSAGTVEYTDCFSEVG